MLGRNRKMGLCFSKNLTRVLVEESPPLDVKRAFSEYVGGSSGGTHMTAEQLLRFAVEAQGEESAGEEDVEAIINEVVAARHQLTKFMRHGLNLDDFFHFLFSPDLNPPIINKVHQEMDAPLSHYFIYTSHNSYLTGNQISSECSDVPLIKALQRGVRALELDLWPNSTKDDILVLHGWAWTPPVELIKCLRSIKEHAFSASPYPVILTLEDHLTPDLQAKAAQMINETFGEMVFIADGGCLKEFPSPEKLKHRVVISTKPPKDGPDPTNPTTSLSKEQNAFCEDESGKLPSDNSADQDDLDKVESDTAEQNHGSRLLAYKLLIAIPSGNAKNGLKESLVVSPDKIRRLSLREQKFEKATELYGTEVVRFTQKNLLRIFPKATRVNSSNYKPSTGWMYGAQMVAFNMQGYGRSLWLMHGMFRANGGCGYVKKPDFLMNVGPDCEVFDPTSELPVKKILKVKVYMGDGWDLDFSRTCFNTCSPPDLYTKVAIAGVPADKATNRTKRKDNSWKPVWDEEFVFRLTVPELALLRVEVHHYNMPEKDDFAGQTCLPVWELKPGLRAVPLFDRKGERLGSVRLLMRFQFF